jgi:hypothetical protein
VAPESAQFRESFPRDGAREFEILSSSQGKFRCVVGPTKGRRERKVRDPEQGPYAAAPADMTDILDQAITHIDHRRRQLR